MADLNANINVGIETTQALNQLKALQKQISQFHQSVAKSSGEAAVAQRDLQRNFLNSVNSIQGFSAELKTVRTTAESFTNSLEKNKFSMREYFRYAGGATKTFGKNFKAEFSTIEKTAIERVKTLQTQYIKMGRDAQGAMQAIAIRPTVLNMKDLGTQTAIAAQKQVLFNQLVKQGSTNLLNFGKNTQWAGRQLMVGFTLPLATLGMTAGRVFFDMEKAAIKFKKVYGDLFTAPEETKKAMDSIVALGEAYATYGIAVSDTLDLAADAAAAGFAGVDLQNQTTAALKLSVLGQLDLQKALETTISLQNAFQLSSADLAGEIDFLNAVENQTVVALEDITTAVPRVAPVIQALGGDVRDLAFFLAAMKEGGVNAAQGANALKSGLASLINPSEKAATMLAGLGVNIRSIISRNQGDLAGTVFEFATALDKLDPLKRAQAIEQLFGKFQFARISALFDNITREGTQAKRVLDLAGSSASELAALSESELGVSAASSMNKFRKSVEEIKVALVPIGELFVEIATPFVEFGTQMLKAFNKLPDGVKTVIGSVITILGGIGPIALMTFGLINNGIANMIKFFATVRLGYLRITGQAKGVGDETQYMTQEQLEAAAAAASLDQAHAGLTQRFTAEKTAVDQLRVAYEAAAAAGAKFALNYPGMMRPVTPTQAQGFAGGGVIRGPGTGTSDSIPAMLSNGEAVIPAKQVKEYAPLIEGMIAGNLPGFANGVMLGMPKSGKATAKNREAADAIYEQFLKSSYANTPPTEYGHQIAPTSGHSFPIFGLGGVYEKDGKRVFVKPVMDETAALAEIRGTQITRQAHGLQAPEQRIVVIRDPMDPKRERRFLALESDLDAKFIQNEPKALFNEEQYFRQLVASLVRVDKDLAAANVFGDVVADVGPAGVFDRASGIRALKTDLPSMEEQAMINLLGIKGGAKRAFAESTLALMAGLTPEQYHQRMIGEIQRVLPALKKTVADFGLSNPTEAKAYDAMIKRLETGLGVDWSKFHSVHSGVKIAVPKKPKAVPGYANGVVSVPGQKGKGDVVPAMLSPGEAVIPAEFAKKYAPLIQAMVAGNIPGYRKGKVGSGAEGRVGKSGATVQRAYQQNVSATAGLVGFEAIDPNDLADLSSIYMKQITEKAKVSVAAIDQEIKQWSEANIEEINKATEAVNSGASATEAYAPLMDKFKKDMEESGGAVDKLNKTFKDMTPALQADLKEAQDYVKEYKLNIKESAADAETLKNALPNNEVAQMSATPGGFGRLSKSRQALTAIQGGSSAIEEKGSPRFMLSPGQHPSSKAYKAASSQEHFSTTTEQELQKAKLAGKRLVESQGKAFAEGIEESTRQASPSKKAYDVGANIGKGAIEGLESEEANAKAAGTQLAKTAVLTKPSSGGPTQSSKFSSSFGNINTKEPVPAVGNAPREVVQAMSQEATATKSFVGDIKASFAAMRENIAREFGWVKEEFKALTGGVKENTSAASQASIDAVQKNLELTKAANNQLVINGEKAGFNYVAAMAGRDGAVEAVVTKKTAEIIKKATDEYNSGAVLITRAVSDGIRDGLPEIEFMGEKISNVLSRKVGQGVSSSPGGAKIPDFAQAGDPGFMQGPKPEFSKFEVAFQKLAPKISNATMAFSAVSGVVSMVAGQLGPEFQAVAGALSIFTGLIFGLIQATQALISLQIKKTLIDKVELALKNKNAIVTAISTGYTALFGTTMLAASSAAMAFLIPIGLVVAALALLVGGIFVVNHILAENEKKIAGLGNAATAAGEKLKLIADLAGFEPTRDPGQRFEESGIGVGADATRQEQVSAGAIKESDQFKEAIKDGGILKADLDALKGAGDNAKIAIETLTANLIALAPEDADPEKIKAVVLALAAEAGLEEVEVNLPMNLNPFVAGNENVVQDFVAGIATDLATNLDKQIDKGMYGTRVLSDTGRSDAQQLGAAAFAGLQQLETALDAGQLSVDEYDKNVAALFANFEEFDPLVIAEANKKMMESFGVPPQIAAGIKNLEAQKAIIQGLSVGIKPGEDEMKALSGLAADASAEDVEKALATLRAQTTVETNKAADAAEKLRQAEVARKAEVDLGLIEDEIAANSAKLEQAEELIASGMNEADAMAIATDEKFAGIFATAKQADEQNRLNGVVVEGATEVEEATAAYEAYKNSIEAVNNATQASKLAEWIKNAKEERQLKKDITVAGFGAADAQLILNNEMLRGAFLAADTNEKMDEYKKTLAEFKKLGGASGSAGASAADPIGDAIKALKEQRQEIINTSKAFATLRKKGMDANKAMRFAQNPQLMAAMNAGLKVGSKQWDEIIKRIKAAEAAAKKFQMTTSSGQKQYFDEVYGKVQDFISASENLMRATFEVATAADTSLVSKLENKIKDLNSQIQNYEYSLEEIAEKEDAINKEYDKKAKALENVRRINEDILRQQKSQLSIADALSQGDIAAAASAMQQSREENARAAADSQGNLLDIAKQAQIDSLTAKNGLTREEIEKRIKGLKKEISDIERGELAQAQSRIDAAQRKLDIEIAGISVLGRTAGQWESIKAETDKAQAGAVLYNKELRTSIGLVREMVAGFKNVPGTVGFQKPAASSGFTPTPGNLRPGPEKDGTFVGQVGPQGNFVWNGEKWNKLAGGGMVKKYAGGGMVKPSYFAKGGKVGYYPMGGLIPYKANGGMFKSVNTDTSPAMLTPGEFVVRRSAVEKFGVQNLKNINNGTYGNTRSRDLVQPVYPEVSKNYLSGNIGGGISSNANIAESNTQVDNSVYNYNLSVNVEGTDVSPDQIANVVMRKLQNFGSQRVRGQVIR